jgi:four helix bundle protein
VEPARRYQDLICWQLADELEQVVFKLTATGPASRDFEFRDQIRDSSSSATRNMAEGFGRYWPSEFSNALNIARGELLEPHNSAGAGLKKGYFAAADADQMQRLAMRSAIAAANPANLPNPSNLLFRSVRHISAAGADLVVVSLHANADAVILAVGAVS